MSIFPLLVAKLIPLYSTILIGYIAGKTLTIDNAMIGRLLIYIIAPSVIFSGTATIDLKPSYLLLPCILFVLCCSISLFAYWIGKYFYKDSSRNIAAFTAGTGNTGYFGIPVATALFGPEALGFIVLCTLGFVLYENTLGFYLTAKGQFSAKDSVYKLLRLPTIYAFIAGISLQVFNITMPAELLTMLDNFKGAYSVLGMMMIGLAVAGIQRFNIDLRFLSGTLFVKFLLWPAVIGLLIFVDSSAFHLFSPFIYNILLLLSIVPLASNTVALAATFKLHTDKAAIAVFLSTIVGLILIPLVFIFMG